MSEGRESVERNSKTGRFTKGNRGGPGRPPSAPKTLVQALKERLDPDELAVELLKRSKTSDALLMYVYNRLEGMPRQAVEVEHKDDPPAVKAMRELQQALIGKARDGRADS